MAYLECLKTQQKYNLDHYPFKIGRSKDADIVCLSLTVSRNHCELRKDVNGVWNLFDAGSSGTQINDKTVKGGALYILNDCDIVKVGTDEAFQWKFVNPVFQENINSEDKGQLKIEVERLRKALDEEQKRCEQKIRDQVVELEAMMITKNLELEALRRSKEESVVMEIQKKHLEQEELHKQLAEVNANLEECINQSLREREDAEKQLREQHEQLLHLSKVKEHMEGNLNEQVKKKTEAEEMVNQLALVVAQQSNSAESAVLIDQVENILQSELECGICNELFITAITLNCAHTFCRYCLNIWQQKICPYCRTKIVSENRALALDNYIQKVVDSLSSEFRDRRQVLVLERMQAEEDRSKRTTSARGGRGRGAARPYQLRGGGRRGR